VDDISELVRGEVEEAVGLQCQRHCFFNGDNDEFPPLPTVENDRGSPSSLDGMEQRNVLVKVDSSVRELAERSSLLELGGLLSVLYQHKKSSAPSIR
jgi:hypothetical protein